MLDPEPRTPRGGRLGLERAFEGVEHLAVRAVADRVDADLVSFAERPLGNPFEVRGSHRLEPAVAGVVALNIFGERRSLGELIERTPGLSQIDRMGRL